MVSMMTQTGFLNALSRADSFGSTHLGTQVIFSETGILKYYACSPELKAALLLLFGEAQ